MGGEEGASTGEATQEPTTGGWTTDRVRDGFDIDGAESEVHPLGTDSRIRLARAQHEVWRGALGDARALYPAIRAVGTVLNRDRAAEQWIAESEYVRYHARTGDRTGIGTKRWWLGLAYSLLAWATVGALGIAVAVGFALVFTRLVSDIGDVAAGTARLWSALILILGGTVGIVWLVVRVARTADT